MHKRFPSRPLALCLAIMSFFCLVLLILYHFAQRENTLLRTAGTEQFTTLAAAEAEDAVRFWEEGAPVALVYHKLAAAADYLSMVPHTEETEAVTAALREAGEGLLQGADLDGDTAALLTNLYDKREMRREQMIAPAETAPVMAEKLPATLLAERADLLTGTGGLLHPAAGDGLVYVCQNMYVRLDEGGLPVELAVYPPMGYEAAYDGKECRLAGARLLEKVLPGFYARPGGTEPVWEEVGPEVYRAIYNWKEKSIETVVRRDTGRLVGLKMRPAEEGASA